MIWFMVLQVVSTLVELIRLGRKSESEKNLEILLLRKQLAIYERKQERAPHLSRGEKLTLVVLAMELKAQTGRTIKALGDIIREIFETFDYRSLIPDNSKVVITQDGISPTLLLGSLPVDGSGRGS